MVDTSSENVAWFVKNIGDTEVASLIEALAAERDAALSNSPVWRDRIYQSLRSYQMSNMCFEDMPDVPFPLVDLMSDGNAIDSGEREMELLADFIAGDLIAHPAAPGSQPKPVLRPDWEGFGRALMEDWPTGDIDGSHLFDMSLKYGLIAEVPGGYNPDEHIDAEGICPERGDPWYEYTFGSQPTEQPPQADVQGADASLCIECGATLSSPSEAICYVCASSAARALAGEE